MAERPLWVCPKCGKPFVTANLWHSCSVVPWEQHFEGKPKARELFEVFRRALEQIGTVTLVSNRSDLKFMTRVRFAGCKPRKDWLLCHLWLKRRASCPRFVREEIYGRDIIYRFDLRRPEDLDDEILEYLREAYRVGQQRA